MTRRERLQIYWFIIACCVVTGAINWSVAQAPSQPTLRQTGGFDPLVFKNGSIWYLREGTINAVWAIPPADQDEMGGVKTKIYGTGYEVNSFDDVNAILDQIYASKIAEYEEMRRRIEEQKNESKD